MSHPPLLADGCTVNLSPITKGSKRRSQSSMCSSQRVPPPQPALLCHQPHFSQQLLILQFPETARCFSIPRCPGEFVPRVSPPLSHGPSPCPAPAPPPPHPPTCLPSSQSSSPSPSCCTSGTSPASAGSPVPSLPLFRTGQRKEKGGPGCIHYFY